MGFCAVRRKRLFVLVSAALAGLLLFAGLAKPILVLEISSPPVLVPMAEGDLVVHTYLQSMYDAAVSERFRIEQRRFHLFHVMTDCEACLAYLGLARKDEPNVDLTFQEFGIPAASIGNHVIRIHGREIPLDTHEGRSGTITVQLRQMSLFMYFLRLIRG